MWLAEIKAGVPKFGLVFSCLNWAVASVLGIARKSRPLQAYACFWVATSAVWLALVYSGESDKWPVWLGGAMILSQSASLLLLPSGIQRDYFRKSLEEKQITIEELASVWNEKETVHQEKSDLLRVLCHDISNSLTALQALFYAYDNRPNKVKPKKDIAFWDLMETMVQRAKTVTEAQVSLVRSIEESVLNEAAFGKFELTPVSLSRCVDASMCIFEHKLKAKGIQIEVDVSARHVVLGSRNALINHVFANLLSNSIKFSEPGTKITISSTSLPEFIEVIFEDQGVGIPGFSVDAPFSRRVTIPSRVGTQGETGHGRGLGIIAQVMESCGAEMSISSIPKEAAEGVQSGTTIRLLFKRPSSSVIVV